ncbi:hypothetical protein RI367_003013 [Sorochytrium milnesiophthora]
MTNAIPAFISERYTIAEQDSHYGPSPFTHYLGRDKVSGGLVSIRVERRKPGQTFETDQEARVYKRMAGHGHAGAVNQPQTMLHHHKVLDRSIIVLRHTPASLQDVVSGCISELVMFSIMTQIITAVQQMHAANVVHPSLEPLNVRVDRSGNVVLVNFRQSSAVHAQGSRHGHAAAKTDLISLLGNWWSVGMMLMKMALSIYRNQHTAAEHSVWCVLLRLTINLATDWLTLVPLYFPAGVRRVITELFGQWHAAQRNADRVFDAHKILSTLAEVSGDQKQVKAAMARWVEDVIEPLYKKDEAAFTTVFEKVPPSNKTVAGPTNEAGYTPAVRLTGASARTANSPWTRDIQAAIQSVLQQWDLDVLDAAGLTPQQAGHQEQRRLLEFMRVHQAGVAPHSSALPSPLMATSPLFARPATLPAPLNAARLQLSPSFMINHVLIEPSVKRATSTKLQQAAVDKLVIAVQPGGKMSQLPSVRAAPDAAAPVRDGQGFGQ